MTFVCPLQAAGGAVLLHAGGTIGLSHSTFQANFDAQNSSVPDGGVGIENRGGEVQCDTAGCLPVCTVCLSLSPPPTPQPTAQDLPTPPPTIQSTVQMAKHRRFDFYLLWLVLGCLAVVLSVIAFVARNRWACCSALEGFNFGWTDESRSISSSSIEMSPGQQPLMQLAPRLSDAANSEHESTKLVLRSILGSYEHTPAPVFVVSGGSMRVSLWSPGMEIAAPVVMNPVGCLLSSLPFVNADDGYRLHRMLRRIFEAPDEHDKAKPFMLYLRTNAEPVLLEMVAHWLAAEPEAFIVMTGRIVSPALAGFIACESAAALSETNRDGVDEDEYLIRSASQTGSMQGDDDDHPLTLADHRDKANTNMSSVTMSNHSIISSVTMPPFENPQSKTSGQSTISSLTMPTFLAPHADPGDPGLRSMHDAADDTNAQFVTYAHGAHTQCISRVSGRSVGTDDDWHLRLRERIIYFWS